MSNFYPLESRLRAKGFFVIAGIDEAGRGPLAGPVVSAAVILKKGARLPGLTDSKKLSAKKREVLFEKVINASVDFAISVVSHQVIDRENILNATRLANMFALKNLKIRPDYVLVDGRDKQFFDHQFATIVKGDLYIKSIAAASILAKVARDKIMTKYAEMYPVYGFEKHMGYGTRQHRANIEKYGRCEIHRESFKIKSL